MAAYRKDEGGDDFAFIVLVATGAYLIWQWWRDQSASGEAGTFPAASPASSPAAGIMNILIPLQLSPQGAAFIKQQEGLSLSSYSDGAGTSIGYGHQIQPGENIISPITQDEADQLFNADAAAAAQVVSNAVTVQLSQAQFDALVDFAFNVGATAFRNSTLLQLLNQGNFSGAAQQFSAWVKSNGQTNPGLVARRNAETQLFTGA